MNILTGIFLLLHGLVHLLYSGQSVRLFELQSGMSWPDGSWAFAGIFGNEAARIIAGGSLILATIGFVVAGIALFASQDWWRLATIISASFSVAVFVLFWDGSLQALADKGLFGILINAAILVALLVFKWPRFGF